MKFHLYNPKDQMNWNDWNWSLGSYLLICTILIRTGQEKLLEMIWARNLEKNHTYKWKLMVFSSYSLSTHSHHCTIKQLQARQESNLESSDIESIAPLVHLCKSHVSLVFTGLYMCTMFRCCNILGASVCQICRRFPFQWILSLHVHFGTVLAFGDMLLSDHKLGCNARICLHL